MIFLTWSSNFKPLQLSLQTASPLPLYKLTIYERFQSEGILPSLKILFARFVIDLMVSLPADLIIKITIPDGPAALPVFIFAMALEIIPLLRRELDLFLGQEETPYST